MPALELIEPATALLPQFIDYCREFPDPEDIPGIGDMDPRDPAPSIAKCRNRSLGINVPEGRVSADTYWLVENNDRMLGTINLRHALTPSLLKTGGHVGYSVRLSDRRKGHATTMLERIKVIALQRGISRLLLTCDARNLGSSIVIERCGGILENKVPSTTPGREWTLRYWIEL